MLIDIRTIDLPIPIRGVIHVGANTCEEQPLYNELGIPRVVWIEARGDAFEHISSKKPNIGKCRCYYVHAAVDDQERSVPFYVTSNAGASSSLLQLGTHKEKYPNITVEKEVEVFTYPLNKIVDKLNYTEDFDINDFNFINLDIQGTELRALKSFDQHLDKMDYVYTEVNKEYLYNQCALLKEIEDFLFKYGFRRLEIKIIDKYQWGDALYYRP